MSPTINKLFFPGLFILYIITRLINYKIIPIFVDEAIYSRWAQIVLNDPANRYISLQDGKQPLFIWLSAISQSIISDPLVATRLVSTAAGFGSLIGIYLLAKELLNKKTAILSAFLYIILPFSLLYDRLALFDSLLTMLIVFAVLLTVKMASKANISLAILNGIALGFAMITKSSGVIYLYLLPISLILFQSTKQKLQKKFIRWVTLTFLTFVLAQIIYNSLRLSALFYLIEIKNYVFIRTFNEVLSDPFLFFVSNLKTLIVWLVSYIGLPLFAFFLLGLLLGFYKKQKAIVYLFLLIITPLIVETIFNKVIFPRFILFYFPFIILIISFAITHIFSKYKYVSRYLLFILIVSLVIPINSSLKLLFNPPDAKIADTDSLQYTNSWPAGYGVDDIVNLLKQESKTEKIIVGTEGTFGLLPFALEIYLNENQNIRLIGYWPVDTNKLPSDLLQASKDTKTYLILNENQKEVENPNLSLVNKYKKGNSDSHMRVFRVNP